MMRPNDVDISDIRVLVLDIDGTLVGNKMATAGNSNKILSRIPGIKRLALLIVEIFEMIFKINRLRNEILIKFIRKAREDNPSLRIYVLTDRSALGMINVKEVAKWLKLTDRDAIQVRSLFGLNESKLQETLKTRAKIFSSVALKPSVAALAPLSGFLRRNGIESSKALIVDDHQGFMNVAKAYIELKTASHDYSEIYKMI